MRITASVPLFKGLLTAFPGDQERRWQKAVAALLQADGLLRIDVLDQSLLPGKEEATHSLSSVPSASLASASLASASLASASLASAPPLAEQALPGALLAGQARLREAGADLLLFGAVTETGALHLHFLATPDLPGLFHAIDPVGLEARTALLLPASALASLEAAAPSSLPVQLLAARTLVLLPRDSVARETAVMPRLQVLAAGLSSWQDTLEAAPDAPSQPAPDAFLGTLAQLCYRLGNPLPGVERPSDDPGPGDWIRRGLACQQRLTEGLERESDPLGRVLEQIRLGFFHQRVAEHAPEDSALDTALAVFEQARAACPSPRPQGVWDWAWAAARLGEGLVSQNLSWRRPAADRIALAEQAYEEALACYPSDTLLHAWAHTRIQLGAILTQSLNPAQNRPRVERCLAMLQETLAAVPRARMPLLWSMLQTNIAIAQSQMGELDNKRKLLRQALKTLDLSEEESPRSRVPWDWAILQFNRGALLSTYAARCVWGKRHFQRALAAFEAAQGVWTREDVPQNWGRLQVNIGNAHTNLADRCLVGEEEIAGFEQAAKAYRRALEVLHQPDSPTEWAQAWYNLGTVLFELGMRREGLQDYSEAVDAFRQARRVYHRDLDIQSWRNTLSSLANSLSALCERRGEAGGTSEVEEALSLLKTVRESCDRTTDPANWGTVQNNLGYALRVLGERRQETALLQEAVAVHEDAQAILKPYVLTALKKKNQNNLAVAKAALQACQESRLRSKERIEWGQ